MTRACRLQHSGFKNINFGTKDLLAHYGSEDNDFTELVRFKNIVYSHPVIETIAFLTFSHSSHLYICLTIFFDHPQCIVCSFNFRFHKIYRKVADFVSSSRSRNTEVWLLCCSCSCKLKYADNDLRLLIGRCVFWSFYLLGQRMYL